MRFCVSCRIRNVAKGSTFVFSNFIFTSGGYSAKTMLISTLFLIYQYKKIELGTTLQKVVRLTIVLNLTIFRKTGPWSFSFFRRTILHRCLFRVTSELSFPIEFSVRLAILAWLWSFSLRVLQGKLFMSLF